MRSLLLMSVLIATFVLPAAAAASRRPRKALRALLVLMAAAELGYAIFLRFVFERLQ